VVGILSGLFGIGGGALMVPLMLVVFNFPASLGVATSMFLVLQIFRTRKPIQGGARL